MDNQDVLEKAIRLAINGGWEPALAWSFEGFREPDLSVFSYDDLTNQRTGYYRLSANDIIFNHQFAKALWSEKQQSITETMINSGTLDWKQHLQMMVISDNPLEYLGDNI